MQEIWTEKYRPRALEDVAGQEAVVDRLKAYVKTRNLPHLLFAGTAGTGKTTCAIALARELFGEELWKQNFSEMNASDERGIQIVRTNAPTKRGCPIRKRHSGRTIQLPPPYNPVE